MSDFKKGDFITTVPFDLAIKNQTGPYINGMDKNDWPPCGIIHIISPEILIVEYNNDSWPVPTKFIKQKFSIGDKVNVIPWLEAVKTNLYNSVENEVYGIPESDWFKLGSVLGFQDRDVLVGNIYEVWYKFPPEFLIKQ